MQKRAGESGKESESDGERHWRRDRQPLWPKGRTMLTRGKSDLQESRYTELSPHGSQGLPRAQL